MSDIANNFIESPEFDRLNSQIDSEELFVDYLYKTVLNRAPSKNEVNFYRIKLELGLLEKGEAVLAFSESFEHVNLVIPLIYDEGWI